MFEILPLTPVFTARYFKYIIMRDNVYQVALMYGFFSHSCSRYLTEYDHVSNASLLHGVKGEWELFASFKRKLQDSRHERELHTLFFMEY